MYFDNDNCYHFIYRLSTDFDKMIFKTSQLTRMLASITLCSLNSGLYADTDAVVLPTIELHANRSDNIGYTIGKTTATNKLDLDVRHTPQSIYAVTSQQIEEQNLNSTDDILTQVPGVNVIRYGQLGAGYTTYYSRGFAIQNIQRDGIPTTSASFGGSDMLGIEDSAIYERVEVIKGSNGLTNGSGQPSASINYVRKRPTEELTGSIKLQAGSWDNYRSQVDISGALSDDGSIRGRAIGVYDQGGSQQDRFDRRNALFYGALDFDLDQNTILSTALSLQQIRLDQATPHGFPFVSHESNRQQVHFGPNDNPAAEWTYSDTDKLNIFLGLEHQFQNGWKGVANYSFTHADNDRVYGVAGSGGITYKGDYVVNKDLTLHAGQMAVTSGRIRNSPDVHSLDLYGNGNFNFLGRQHQLSIGLNGYRIKSDDPKYNRYFSAVQIDGWDGKLARPDMPEVGRNINDEQQYGGFLALDLNLLDPLKLLLGSRVSQWERKVTNNQQKQNGIFTPYIGLVYDINERYSAYTSYTSIFNPSSNEDSMGNYLDPEEGNSFEVGIKANYFDGRLNTSAAYYQMKQDNFAVKDGTIINPNGKQAYTTTNGAEIKGVDISLAGELLPNWNIQAGYSYIDAKNKDGEPLKTDLPEHNIKIFTTYQWNKWTLGGGVNWQSKIYDAGAKGIVAEYNRQPSYALVSLMGRYEVRPDLSLGLNVNNLLDEEYKVNTSNTWGTGRQITGSLSYQF